MSRLRFLVFALGALALGTPPVHAGWTPEGALILPPPTEIHLLSACEDGAGGTFVAWQEGPRGGAGTLRVLHVLPTGDPDPTWPAEGAHACDTLFARTILRTSPDGLGGVYLWWLEGRALFVSRIDAGGHVAAGWPDRGMMTAFSYSYSRLPGVVGDGAHGLFVVWATGGSVPSGEDGFGLWALALGPDGQVRAGWPAGGKRVVPPTTAVTWEIWPQVIPSNDGGLFLAYASWSLDTAVTPSSFRLVRLTGDGDVAAGWPAEGIALGALGPLESSHLSLGPLSALVAIAPDADGGAYVLAESPIGTYSYYGEIDSRLHRRRGDGGVAEGWPAAGLPVEWAWYRHEIGADGSARLHADGRGGVIAVSYRIATDSPLAMEAGGYDAHGALCPGSGAILAAVGHEVVPRGDGGYFLAHLLPAPDLYAPPWYWPTWAMIEVGQRPPSPNWEPLLHEHHESPYVIWYGDIALAPTGDGGVVFFWSQLYERFGLFARRFTPAGEVVSAPAAVATGFGLRAVRFEPGAGVRARVALEGTGGARLELYDLAGRRLAGERFGEDARGEREVTLAGTAGLSPGVYFARLAQAGRAVAVARVAVVR